MKKAVTKTSRSMAKKAKEPKRSRHDSYKYITQTHSLLNEMGKMAKIGAWELDVETMKQLWTDETYEIHDVDKRTYDPNVDQEVNSFVPASRERIGKAVADAIKYGKPYDLELEMITVKGNHKMVRAIGNIYKEHGKVKRVFGSVQDITERVMAERKLRKSEAELREAQEMAHLGHWHWDVKTGNVEWSDEVYKIFRLDPNTFKPQIDSILKLSPWPGEHERNMELVDRAIKSHSPGSYEQKFLRPDNSIGYYFSTFHGNYNDDGELVSIVGTVMDITERKKVEEHLREIDRAKTEFVSLASHQLRTPLTTISWYTEMILRGDVGSVLPNQRRYLEEIYQGNVRMVELVNTLLDVSRIELGKMMSAHVPTDVGAVVESVVHELAPRIGQKQLTVSQYVDTTIPTIVSDPKFLRIIFQNLLANAVAYTPERGTISVSVSRVPLADVPRADMLSIRISDTGYGIPQEQQDKIFTKLFRADNVREKDTDGTGLGLYIVKSIVEQMKGKIHFESVEHKGTTFFVTMPFTPVSVDAKQIT